MSELYLLRNKIGSISAMKKDDCTDDNLAIVIASYFEEHLDKPKNAEIDDEIGWSFWAVEKTNCLLDRIIKILKES